MIQRTTVASSGWIAAYATALLAALWMLAGCAAPRGPATVHELEAGIAAEGGRIRHLNERLEAVTVRESLLQVAEPEAAPRAYYAKMGLQLSALDEYRHKWAAMALTEQLQRGHAAGFEYVGPEASVGCTPPWSCEEELLEVPLPVLVAARFAAAPAFLGAEFDFIAAVGPDMRHGITIWHEPNGRIVAEDRFSPLTPPVGAAADEPRRISEASGIELVESGSSSWTPTQLGSLDEALSLLTPAEREVIRGLPFRREREPPPGSHEMRAGQFRVEENRRWIDIFDRAFEMDSMAFVGSLEVQHSASVQVILHEIGHAISVAPMLELMDSFSERIDSVNDLVASFNRLGRRIRPGEMQHFQRMKQELSQMVTQLGSAQQDLAAIIQRGVSQGIPTPLLTDFAAVPGALPGITPYGQTTLAESFAEAFSVCRLDANACQRVSPALAEYFTMGRHLHSSWNATD